MIDRTGAWMFRIDADGVQRAISSNKDGGAAFGWHFQRDDRWGLLDLDGHVLLIPSSINPSNAAPTVISSPSGKGSSSISGAMAARCSLRTERISAGCGSLSPYVMKAGDKFGLMDGNGRVIAPAAFEALNAVTKDVWNAKLNGKWGRIGPDGHWLFEAKFDDLRAAIPPLCAQSTASAFPEGGRKLADRTAFRHRAASGFRVRDCDDGRHDRPYQGKGSIVDHRATAGSDV